MTKTPYLNSGRGSGHVGLLGAVGRSVRHEVHDSRTDSRDEKVQNELGRAVKQAGRGEDAGRGEQGGDELGVLTQWDSLNEEAPAGWLGARAGQLSTKS